jgi:hypothetical protein
MAPRTIPFYLHNPDSGEDLCKRKKGGVHKPVPAIDQQASACFLLAFHVASDFCNLWAAHVGGILCTLPMTVGPNHLHD